MGLRNAIRALFGIEQKIAPETQEYMNSLFYLNALLQEDKKLLTKLTTEYWEVIQSLQNITQIYNDAWKATAPFLMKHRDKIGENVALKLTALEDQADTALNDVNYRLRKASEITDEIYTNNEAILEYYNEEDE